MQYRYSSTQVDPDTGQVYDVLVVDDDEGYEYRNADARDHRQNTSPGRRPPWAQQSIARQNNSVPPSRPQYGQSRPAQSTGQYYTRATVAQPQPVEQPGTGYFSIRKAAVVELIPAAGSIWAAWLGMPGRPIATGDNKIDHDNQTMHTEALARHQQNQARIKAASDLAGRLMKLFVG